MSNMLSVLPKLTKGERGILLALYNNKLSLIEIGLIEKDKIRLALKSCGLGWMIYGKEITIILSKIAK